MKINASPHRVLGDDQDGPHSSAMIVGRRTVLACAHSLGLLADEAERSTKSKTYLRYLEDYWIQPSFSKDVKGNITAVDRVPLKLFKFHLGNDWALFVRADDNLFAKNEVATIDTSLQLEHIPVLKHQGITILHCPVSLQSSITMAKEFYIGCNISHVHLQGNSSHHIKYEGHDLCRGSSGAGVYLSDSTSVVGMHIEAITEAEYENAAEDHPKIIAYTDKRVNSEDSPYQRIETSDTPPTKKMKTDSETVASLAGGNNGQGSALIICKFHRLMHYIEELEKEKLIQYYSIIK